MATITIAYSGDILSPEKRAAIQVIAVNITIEMLPVARRVMKAFLVTQVSTKRRTTIVMMKAYFTAFVMWLSRFDFIQANSYSEEVCFTDCRLAGALDLNSLNKSSILL